MSAVTPLTFLYSFIHQSLVCFPFHSKCSFPCLLNHYGKYSLKKIKREREKEGKKILLPLYFKHSSFKSLKSHRANQLTQQFQMALNFKKTEIKEIKDPLPYKFLSIIQEVGVDINAKFKSKI